MSVSVSVSRFSVFDLKKEMLLLQHVSPPGQFITAFALVDLFNFILAVDKCISCTHFTKKKVCFGFQA